MSKTVTDNNASTCLLINYQDILRCTIASRCNDEGVTVLRPRREAVEHVLCNSDMCYLFSLLRS